MLTLKNHLKINQFLCLIAAMFIYCSQVWAIDNWASFYTAYQTGSSDIAISSDIYAQTALGTTNRNNFSIIGNSFSLSGNGFKGFLLNDNQISFKNIVFDDFSDSIVGSMGGAVFEARSSTLSFTSVKFLNNYAEERGGVIYANASSIVFENNVFENNVSNRAGNNPNGGGALHITNSNILFKGLNKFIKNTASSGNGGAIYTNVNSIWNLYGQIEFTSNSAARGGGAVYILASTMSINGFGKFSNNTAQNDGGAIYTDNSKLNISAESGAFIFEGNKAINGMGADIYLKSNSSLSLNATGNNKIIMKGGIASDNSANKIVKLGLGEWALSGKNDYSGSIDIKEGKFSLTDIETANLGSLAVKEGAVLQMADGKAATVWAKEIELNGNIEADLIKDGNTLKIDSIKASDTIKIGSNSSLSLLTTLSYGDLTAISLPLGYAEGGISGSFTNTDFYFGKGFGYSLVYENQYVYLTISSGVRPSFDIPNLSGNAKESFDAVYNLSPNIPYTSDLVDIRDYLQTLAGNTEQERQIADSLSGGFLADIMALPIINNGYSGKIYSQINEAEGIGEDIRKSIWIEGGISALEYKENISKNINSLKNSSFGMLAGFSFITSKEFVFGAAVGYEMNSAKREKNEASMEDMRFTLYGGYFDAWFNLRWNLSGGIENFKSDRHILWNANVRTPSAEFQTVNFSGGFEMEFPIWLSAKFDLKPFAAAQAGYISNPQIVEKAGGGDESVNLTIQSGNNIRLAPLGGVKLSMKTRSITWHIKGYAEYNALGNELKFDVHFSSDPSNTAKIKSSEIDALVIGGGFGADFALSENIFIGLNGDIKMNSSLLQYFANAAFTYKFSLAENKNLTVASMAIDDDDLYKGRGDDFTELRQSVGNSEKTFEDGERQAPQRQNINADGGTAKENVIELKDDAVQDVKKSADKQLTVVAAPKNAVRAQPQRQRSKTYRVNLKQKTKEEIAREEKEFFAEPEKSPEDKAVEFLANTKTKSELAAMSDDELLAAVENRVQKEKKPVKKTVNLLVSTFKKDAVELTKEVKETVKQMADNLKKYAFKKAVVEGHSDSSGSAVKNFFVSKMRARAVYAELREQGIPADKIEYRGAGSERPAVSNKTAYGQQQNRRVEISIE
ncbi:MAG: autotransporter domain-containing protein [Elusimicrobiota bacterium]|jgi:autotransporter-associated beta strand protein/predicted outer membrane repeat protein|nr:autotransporter domain-containing protein [Elusimicrobiota bacterium]